MWAAMPLLSPSWPRAGRRPDIGIPVMVSDSSRHTSKQDRKLLQKARGRGSGKWNSSSKGADLVGGCEEQCRCMTGNAAWRHPSRPTRSRASLSLSVATAVVAVAAVAAALVLALALVVVDVDVAVVRVVRVVRVVLVVLVVDVVLVDVVAVVVVLVALVWEDPSSADHSNMTWFRSVRAAVGSIVSRSSLWAEGSDGDGGEVGKVIVVWFCQ